MKSKLPAFAVLVVFAASTNGCGIKSDPTGDHRKHQNLVLPLPSADPENNLLTRSIGEEAGHPSLVVVSEREFNAAYGQLSPRGQTSSNVDYRNIAFAAGEIANDPWTGGIIAHQARGAGSVTSNVFLVARDPQVAASGEVLVTQYFVAAIAMTFRASWSATAVGFGKVANSSSGTGRCCGANKVCATDSAVPPPGCPTNGMCGDTTLIQLIGSSVNDSRTAAGLPPVQVKTYNGGTAIDAFCFPRVVPECQVSTPMCNSGGALDLTRTWEAEIPIGSNCTSGGSLYRPVSGRQVPKMCTYAQGGIFDIAPAGSMMANFGGGHPLPECDGRCVGCEGSARPVDSTFRPRQCAVVRTVQGSGVCESTPQQVAVEQGAMRSRVASLGSNGHLCEAMPLSASSNSAGFMVCTDCDATSCKKTVRPSKFSPFANPTADCSTSSQSGCTAPPTVAGTSATDGTAGSGSTAGAGRVVSDSTDATVSHVSAPPPDKDPTVSFPNTAGPANAEAGGPGNMAHQQAASVADPVLLSDGSFELDHTDLSFSGPVRSLEFKRSYNSRSQGRSELGSNWTHNWDIRVVPLDDSNRPDWVDPFCSGSPLQTTCVILHNGWSQQLFTRDLKTGLFMPQAGVMTTLVEGEIGGWALRSADGHVSQFDVDGYLTRDEDRFGNAFNLVWETNAAGKVFDAICPRKSSTLDANGAYVDAMGPGGLYSSARSECALLAGLTGRRRPMAWGVNSSPALSFKFPGSAPSQELVDGRNLIIDLQTTSGRKVGSGSPWGYRSKRLVRVSDTQARSLSYEYYPDADRTLIAGSNVYEAGMLRAVTGPAGARVEFEYGSPAGHPVQLNEVFLTKVTRNDDASTGVAGLSRTPTRAQTFTYAWASNTAAAADLTAARNRYTAFLNAYVNCTYHGLNSCGYHTAAGFTLTDTSPDIEAHVAGFLSDIADNIIRVTTAGTIESETRYETNLFAPNFDRVTRQRWGSTFATASAASSDFATTLPEAQFAYVEAGATNGSLDDATTAFLGSVVASRYPLEPVDGAAQTSASGKGMLLPADSPLTSHVSNALPPISEGELIPASGKTVCQPGTMPALRSRIAGYRPSLDYFDVAVPSTLDPEAPTPGVDLDAALMRSRLSCDMLARAQTWDSRHNDLQWTWAKQASGDYVGTRITGRRKYMNANANRICAWTRYVDRDGDTHMYGLNYHGRVLVDAVQLASQWKFAESLYNADGNVISQRRTLPEGQAWTSTAGDTRYGYMDVVEAGGVTTALMPWYWARRGNVTGIYQHPRGGVVADEDESSPGVFTNSKGRYSRYDYEPFFNQVQRVVSGSITSLGVYVPTLTTTVIFDYQELRLDELTPLLDQLQAFGYQFEVDKNSNPQTYLYSTISAHLPVTFGHGDVNGDTLIGGTLKGLPVRVLNETPAPVLREFSLYRWSPSGRPYFIQRPDGSAEGMSYLDPAALSGTGSLLGGGAVASLRHIPRKTWPSAQGPLRAPCPFLPGPYQWLLPSTCSSAGLQSELETQLKLPTEAAQAIVANASTTRTQDGTVSFEYFVTGQVKTTTRADGSRVDTTRDVDGRVMDQKLYDSASALHSRTVSTYDAQMRPTQVQRFDALGGDLGKRLQAWDEEGHLLYDCSEFVAGGCARVAHGDLPANGTSSTFWYSPEGSLKKTQDAEGATTEYFRDARKWVTRIAKKATGETTRGSAFTYDDDGQVLTAIHGGEFTTLVSEARSYDGLSRLVSLTDTEGRRYAVGTSSRDVTVRVDVLGAAGQPPLWRSLWRYDKLGRVVEELTNNQVTRQVTRGAGGEPYRSKALGGRWVYTTSNADGLPVYSEDEGGEIITVRTSFPDSRLVTESQVDQKLTTVLTTSVLRLADVLGEAVQVTETGAGTSQTRLSRPSTFVRNASGFVTQVTQPDGASVENVVDFLGRPTLKNELATAGFEQSRFTYDRRGALLTVQDPGKETTTYSYTGFGEPNTKSSPGTPTVLSGWAYDLLGRIETETTGPNTLTYVYDPLTGRLSKIKARGVIARDYTYDGLGRLEQAQNYNLGLGFALSPVASADRLVTTTLSYDALGRVESEYSELAGRPRRTTTSAWTQPAGWKRDVTRPDGTATAETFDTLGRMASMTRPWSARTTSWEYQGGRETRVSSTKLGSPFRRTTTYDGLGQALQWTHTSVDVDGSGNPVVAAEGLAVCPGGWNASCGVSVQAVSVLRDSVGRIGSFTRQVARPNVPVETSWRGYTYDVLGRIATTHEAGIAPTVSASTHTLTATQVVSLASSASASNWGYSRGSVGDLVSITNTNGSAAARYTTPLARGVGHQLARYTVDGATNRDVAHDGAGRVLREGTAGSPGTRSYFWDDFSALVGVIETPSNVLDALQYDGLGRLVARWNASGLVEEVAYDGNQMVAAWDGAGNVRWSATWAPGIDSLLSIKDGTGEYLALDDGRANVVGYVRAEDSRLVAQTEFNPEGRSKQKNYETGAACDETGSVRCGPLLGFPFGFHGAYESSGTGLVFFRNRWYSTEAGQWLSQDPLGYVDSFNLYAFNKYDPVNFVDPWGLNSTGVAGEAADWCKGHPADCGGARIADEVVVTGHVTCDSACEARQGLADARAEAHLNRKMGGEGAWVRSETGAIPVVNAPGPQRPQGPRPQKCIGDVCNDAPPHLSLRTYQSETDFFHLERKEQFKRDVMAGGLIAGLVFGALSAAAIPLAASGDGAVVMTALFGAGEGIAGDVAANGDIDPERMPAAVVGGSLAAGIPFGGPTPSPAVAANQGPKLLTAGKPTANLTQKGLEHIVERHWATSGAQNAGKFAQGTSARSLRTMITEAVEGGAVRANTRGRPGQIFEHDFGRTIGSDVGGAATSRLRVVTSPDGTVITAFPY